MATNTKQSLSVTLATWSGDETLLNDCLSSVKDVADEIIIVLGGESILTEKIAKDFHAKLIKTKNNPIFHLQKKMANESATKDWILQIDTDERVTPALCREIKSLLAGKHFGFDTWVSPLKRLFRKPLPLTSPASAYYLPRKNYFLNRYLKNCGQYPDPVIRLFQRGQATLPAKDVHEQMLVNDNIGWLKNDLDHYATPEFSRYLYRENKYSSLHAQELFNQQVPITVFNTLNYLFIKPLITFLSLYLRYRGILDGFPGFVFSLYSGLHHAFSYMKLWEIYEQHKN